MKIDFKVLPDINAKLLPAKAKIPTGRELEEIHNMMRKWLKDNGYEQPRRQ